MRRRTGTIVFVMLLATGASWSQPTSLKYIKPIGVGWKVEQPGLYGWMSFVAFRPDGKQVASDGATTPSDVSGNLSFWKFPEGKFVRKLTSRPTALSPDWKYYASFQGVFDAGTGKSVISLGEQAFGTFVFSPDSSYVAGSSRTLGSSNSRIQIWSLPSGNKQRAFSRYSPNCLAVSPDGKIVASGHWDLVALWNVETGRRIGVLRGFGRYVEGISFSRDGRYLAAGTDAGQVQIWDVPLRMQIASTQLDGGYVSIPAFSPDGQIVAVGIYGTGTVWLIDAHTGKLLDKKLVSGIGCGSVAFSPDGKYLITPSTGGLVTWPYDRGGTIRVFEVVTR